MRFGDNFVIAADGLYVMFNDNNWSLNVIRPIYSAHRIYLFDTQVIFLGMRKTSCFV